MNTEKIKLKLKHLVVTLKRKNPFKLVKEEDGIKLRIEDTSFDPKKDEHSNRVYLITVDGQITRTKEVRKDGDDMVLEYDDKQCAITSKPLIIEDNQFYFTKDGFVGTMALNEDTLLDADVYDPSNDIYERYVPIEEVNWENREDIDMEDVEEVEKDGVEYYKIETESDGDIAMLNGSKKTLREMNKAKRLRKLLEPSSIDKTRLLMAIGSGVAGGYMLYPQMQG